VRTPATIGPDWVPPGSPSVRVYRRGSYRLCLNPEVPAWFVTTRAGLLLFRMGDGAHSLRRMHSVLRASGVPVHEVDVLGFFQSAYESGVYDKPAERDQPCESRKLTAVHLHLTDRCNLACTYCFRNSHQEIPIYHGADDFVAALAKLKPFSSEAMTVTFTGGEPLIHPGFMDIVSASSGLGYRNILLTNGTLLEDSMVGFLAQHFSRVIVSLDGPSEAVNSMTRGPGSFARALRAVQMLAATGAETVVKATVSTSNLEHWKETRAALPEGVRIVFTPLLPMGRGSRLGGEYISDADFVELSRGLACEGTQQGTVRFSPRRVTRRCHAGFSNLSIADTGQVYPCHLFHTKSYELGDIFTDSVEAIIHGRRAQEFIDSIDVERNNASCRGCSVRLLCGGGCKGNTLHATGSHRGADLYCRYLRKVAIDGLFAYYGIGPTGERLPEVADAARDGGLAALP